MTALRAFPGGPLIKTLSSNAARPGLIPSWGARIPHASQPKKKKTQKPQNRNNFVKN